MARTVHCVKNGVCVERGGGRPLIDWKLVCCVFYIWANESDAQQPWLVVRETRYNNNDDNNNIFDLKYHFQDKIHAKMIPVDVTKNLILNLS